jgi:hypothetical protein
MVNRDTIATGCAWINLGAILEMALGGGRLKAFGGDRVGVETGDPRSFGSFAELWSAFRLQAENVMKHTFIQQYKADTLKSSHIASPMFSMLHDLCMAECKDIHSGPIEGPSGRCASTRPSTATTTRTSIPSDMTSRSVSPAWPTGTQRPSAGSWTCGTCP